MASVRRRLQRVPWLAIVAVAALVLGLVPQTSFSARAGLFSLWGDSSQGWGLSPTSISSPGPLLTVSVGETVTLDLFAADSLPHTWCVDYNRNNVCDSVGEHESGVFSSPSTPLTHTFVVPNNPGLFNYGCGVHGFTPMNGPIRIVLSVRPVVSIASPAGSQDWTGGSTHDVVWTMTDPNDPVTALVAYLNYTNGGAPVPIAGPVPGTANPHRVPWTLPLVDSTNVVVNVTVIDPAGNKGWASQPVPRVDSTAPSVVERVPAQGSTGISTATNVIATFGEAMNTTATANPASVALQDTVTSASVPVTYSWNPANTVLTLDPVSNLAPNRMYTAVVNQTAKDASDPGNPLSAVSMWSFTTGSGADITKPRVLGVSASPATQEWGLATNVTASITDDDRVASAWVIVTYPDSSVTNRSMAFASGTTWFRDEAYAELGSYLFHVDAVDPSRNWNRSGSGSFQVRDTTAPAIGAPSVTSPAEVYTSVNVTMVATDPFLGAVGIDIAGVLNESMTFDASSGRWFKAFAPTAVRTYTFVISATDTSGNLATRSGSFDVVDTRPPPVPQNLQAQVAAGNIGIELTWDAVSAPDLAGYNVYRDTSSSGAFATQVANGTGGTAYRDDTAQAGVTYYYRVTAVDVRGHESNPSNIGSAAIPLPPTDVVPYVIAGAGIAVVIAALLAFLVVRRRRQKGA